MTRLRAGLWLAAMLLLAALGPSPLVAATGYDHLDATPPLIERLTPEVLAAIFPAAERVELLDDGGPPAASAFSGDELIGYVFSTLDVLRTPGYSGTPFDVVAGVDLGGSITGAAVLFQREPHIYGDRRRSELLLQFLGDFDQMTTRQDAGEGPRPDFVAGATISARAIKASVREGARQVLGFRTGATLVTAPTLDIVSFRPLTMAELIAGGYVGTARVGNADLGEILARAGAAGKPLELPIRSEREVYLDLRVGLGTPPMIGLNGLGLAAYEKLGAFPAGSQAILFGSDGRYNYQGNTYWTTDRFERIRVLQGGRQFSFARDQYIRGENLGLFTGAFVLPPDSGFDPLAPFTAEIYAYVAGEAGGLEPVLLAAIDYALPDELILRPEPPPIPAWVEAWTEPGAQLEIGILVMALVLLTLIFVFQDRLSRWRRLHRIVRTGFLVFTLVWLGWLAGGQLSIVHLVNYLKAPFQNLDLGFYLAEPLIVIVSLYALVSVVLIGRGVFCGWLCPFGALQELLAQLARLFRLPRWNPPEALQQRLWLGKYVSLAAVLGLTVLVPSAAAAAEEVEPFKTAITAMFARSAPYVVYAGALLMIGLFTERAFCRFLCPLGGALALLDRLHLLTLLKRRPECGHPCKLCSLSCPVRAIEKSGAIKMAECFQCLDCQVEYHDDHRCPPLAHQRKLRARAARGPKTAFAFGGKAVTR